MKSILSGPILLAAGLLLAGSGCGTRGDAAFDAGRFGAKSGLAESSEIEEEVPLDQVPGDILAAAHELVPGFEIREAEREIEDGEVSWSLEGKAGGRRIEIEIEDGKPILDK